MHGFFITGTDTEVGKTVVTAALGLLFQKQGKKIGVMKPVATGGAEFEGRYISEDALSLKNILKLPEPLEVINPICLQHPLAPKVAADQAGQAVDLVAVKAAYEKLKRSSPDVVLIEGVGGVMVPIKHDYLVLDMIKDFGFPVIIVSRPGLGTINHTILTTSILKQERIPIAGIVFNYARKQEKGLAEKTNPSEITRLSGVKILGEIPHLEDVKNMPLDVLERHLDISLLK